MNNTAQPARIRLEHLDGMRGIAALYVLLGHAFVSIRPELEQLNPLALKLLKFLDAGHFAVAIFIVLSGYCLMLPVVRSGGQLQGGFLGYIARRARRILPPYYAALGVSLLLLAAMPQIAKPADLAWQALVSHLLLAHNLFPELILTINGPLWSVALEWQIYFLLPLVFLPVWRRWGIPALLGVACLLGFAPHFFLPGAINFDWTYPWYITLFAIGLCGAVISFSPKANAALERIPWPLVSCLLGAVVLYLFFFRLRWAWDHLWLTDSLLGLATTSVIITLTKAQLSIPHSVAGRLAERAAAFLGSKRVAGLGAFSYSLYLIHEPLLVAFSSILQPYGLSAPLRLAVQYLLVTPLVIGLCYLFYLVFERPLVARPAARPVKRSVLQRMPGVSSES